ncbi:MAG: endonuclease/exonuclease/phosphatase family protein [Flavobacterium sp.]|nr:endonuclease/exonuclease/phosphatase family protein [Flavobacterium sp.]
MKIRRYLILVIKSAMLINAALYLLASLTPFLLYPSLKFGVLLSIGFPFLLLSSCVSAILSVYFFRKQSWLFFIVIVLGFANIHSSIAFNLAAKQPNEIKNQQNLRILSWNVNEFINNERRADTLKSNFRRQILDFFRLANADIICLQDYRDFPEDGWNYNNRKYIIDTLKYPFCYISIDDTLRLNHLLDGYGTAIFSKYPIINSGRIAYNFKHKPEHLNFADIAFGNKKLRVYNTHFRSINLGASVRDSKVDYSFIQDDTAVIFNKGRLYRLFYFDSIHVKQAQIVKQQLNKSPLPFVFCADLNSVPSSYVYHHISSGLQDAFLQKGFGWGPTYDGLSHTLRIDVTLLSPQLKVVQHYCPKLKASDHFPLVTDIALP